MTDQIKVKLNSVDITISHRDKTISLFEWSAMEQVDFYFSDWGEIKSAIDSHLAENQESGD